MSTKLSLTLEDYIAIGEESQGSNDNHISQDRSTQFNNCTFNFCQEPKKSSGRSYEYEDEYVCPNVLYSTGKYCKEYCSDCEEAGAKYQDVAFSPFQLGLPLGLAIAPFFYTFKGLGVVTKLLMTQRVVKSSSESDKIIYSDDTIIDTEIIDADSIKPKMIAEKPRENDLQKWQRESIEHQVEMARLEKEYQQLLTDSNAQKLVRIKMNEPQESQIIKTPKNSVLGALKTFEEAHNE